MPKSSSKAKDRANDYLSPQLDTRKIFRMMARSRALEERMIKMAKSQDGFFWIGGPGEEAFGVALGLQVKKGEGVTYDYLHLHYRSSAIMLAMGMDPLDEIRQMASKATDPFSGGRNFCNHYARKEWNVVPGISPIEVQYPIAVGTAIAQMRDGGDAITIVNGGDGGTAEGDFASCLNWAARPGEELPMLIIVMNNHWGISTRFDEVQGAELIARRADAFNMKWNITDGNNPLVSFAAIREAMMYVRSERKPFLLEAHVSRLYGHSSSSGANRTKSEIDCLVDFEKYLVDGKVLTSKECKQIREEADDEALEALRKVRNEPDPSPDSIWEHTFA